MSQTFSESWHRVAEARVALLPTVTAHKQRFRGEDWYVLRDTYNQRFFRVSPQAYAFVSRLSARRTVDEVWQQCLRDFPTEAPGQEEAMQVLAQLHQSNLLFHDTPSDSQTIFQRQRKQRSRERWSKVAGFLSIRIPLWDPDAWLNRQRALSHALVSWPAAALLLGVLLWGAATTIGHIDALSDQASGLFALENLAWLYLCTALMKTLHELGHAHVVKRFGGEVHGFGVMLLLLVPLPYVDATGSWAFRDRRARALVGAAGILVELFLAALAALVWAHTGPGLLNSLAFNVMVIGSVSSLLFNGNPLLRFDAYYVLSDLLDIPNLYQRAGAQWKYFGAHYLLGTPGGSSPARDRREWWWLTLYGAVSFAYRVLVFATVLLVLADQWLPLAMVFAALSLVMAVILPARRWVTYLRGPAVMRNRSRAVGVSVALVAVPVAVIGWLPLPAAIRAPGVVQSVAHAQVSTGTAGRLEAIEAPHGSVVAAGQVLLRLSNPELEWEVQAAQAAVQEATVLRDQAIERLPSEVAALDKRLAAAQERLRYLRARQEELVVRARLGGTWTAEGLQQRLGSWIPRGQALGEIAGADQWRFSAVVSQEQARELFALATPTAQVRLHGQADALVASQRLVLLPYQSERLPSPTLGWRDGGEVAVRPDDPQGTQALEAYYEMQAFLDPAALPALALHGMTGRVRVALPPQPLFEQARQALLQLVQKRYRL